MSCAPRIVYRRPRASEGLSLTVATSTLGSALGSIGFGGGGGSGMAQAGLRRCSRKVKRHRVWTLGHGAVDSIPVRRESPLVACSQQIQLPFNSASLDA